METTVLKAKNTLSDLLRRAEAGEEVLIRRGRKGPLFRVVQVKAGPRRSLRANPAWKSGTHYRDEDIWASEWKDEG